MLRDTNPNGNDLVGRLLDAINEHDVDDPDFGPPESWPSWTDKVAARLGSAMCRSEIFDEIPDDDREYPF